MNNCLKFLCLIFCLLQLNAEAKQVRVLNQAVEFTGKINTIQRKSLILHNESNQQKEYILKFLRGNIGSSQNIKLCIGEQCYDPRKDMNKIKLVMKPGEVITDLYIEFGLGITETRGTFDLHFSHIENNKDTFIIEAVYDVSNPNADGGEINHKDISIGSIYPNPSNRIAHLDYKIKNKNANVKVVLNSFIGNPVYDLTLDPDQETISINVSELNPGIYFYTVIVDNKNIVTKKLVVKR
ncbi:T9SS type A sorting domain-containing protein [Anditalea andensis]|uniref:Secretion system C-terminal sorting domain-containing protein n=1 Tax=Anditalea andensis TaxID=1048983 RepID=A0A074L351_9BACT|nr:T9SS type A sorting domain-containing protein [Anditalea andensis]KEO74935.1 hypothetical protein EL17_04460 [Anditalea andensis]